jgi:O-antigen/teichoic acid export membrane protein
LALPIFFGLAVFAEQLLNMYEIYSRETHLVLGTMILFQGINLYLSSVGYLLAMSGNDRYYSKLVVISAIIDGVLSFILIPLYGLLGAAIGGGVALAFWNIASFIKCKKIFGFSPSWYPGYKI